MSPALAQRAVTFSVQDQPTYARLTAKWADGDQKAPRISASVSSQVLVLRFDQKVAIDVNTLKKDLGGWTTLVRLDPDGMTARIGLTRTPRLHISTSLEVTAVDLVRSGVSEDPPDIVSPLLIRKAEAAAAPPPPPPPPAAAIPVEVRGSHYADNSRVAFYWAEKVPFKVAEQGVDYITLQFSRRAKPDVAYMRISPPANVGGFETENTDKGYRVTIRSKDKLPIRHYVEEGIPIVDIGELKSIMPDETEAPLSPPPPRTSGRPILLAPPRQVIGQGEKGQVASPSQPQPEAAAPQVVVIGGEARVTALGPKWRDPAPRGGSIPVDVGVVGDGVEFSTSFPSPAAAAVFSRGSAVWVVFASNTNLKLDPADLPNGFRARVQRGPNAAILRIEPPKGLKVSAEADGSSWTVRFSPTPLKPARFLKSERRSSDDGRMRIETMLVGAAGIIWFDDPVVGDQLAVAVSYGPASVSPTARDFVEASFPATAHGVAIAPKSDQVMAFIEGERVVAALGRAVEPKPGETETAASVAPPPPPPPPPSVRSAFIDFAKWGGKTGEDWLLERQKLESYASKMEPSKPQTTSAMLALARFYLGHEMSFEALGILRAAAAVQPSLELDPKFLGLRAAGNVMAGRMAAAEADLSREPLKSDVSAALWRAMVAVDRREWPRAVRFFSEAEDEIDKYPPGWAARFEAAFAEALFNTNDYDAARRRAQHVVDTAPRLEADRARLILANLTAVIDGPDAGYAKFAQLVRSTLEPVAVQAELRRIEAGSAAGKIAVKDAVESLESLRYRWRGDSLELATVAVLADQHMKAGRFRDALVVLQSAAQRDPSAVGAREVRVRLSDYFRRLYLDGEVDRLDPIQALALFYEFADLTPIGADGDLMVRKLAQRLVAFDLLEPAASLLQHQVDNRMRGMGRSSIAVDLATIYLLNKQPDLALSAIDRTRQPNLPRELMLERRLLEAAAYRDMGRYDNVIELVEPLETPEARSFLADAYWRDRKWADAARAYVSMLPPPNEAVKPTHADIAMRAAIAGRLARDMGLLADLRGRYAALFQGNPNQASFELMTSQAEVGGAGLSEAARRMADAPRVDAFSAALKARMQGRATATPPAAASTPASAARPSPAPASG
jgi:tetratricopeptide (TPR) repeat protein